MKAKMRRAIALGTGGLFSVALAAPATATDDAPVVSNTETVRVALSSSGKVDGARIFEQLTVQGNGSIEVHNPVASEGFRKISGFGTPSVEGDVAVSELNVEGGLQQRFVSRYDRDLPVEVTPTYHLDGEPVRPGDIVGRSGQLDVRFRVENKHLVQRPVHYRNGKGTKVSTKLQVSAPYVGSLRTTLPEQFTAVSSDGGVLAGDGTGKESLSFTLTLFEPIGSRVQEFGYTATVHNAVVPPATVSIVPVVPPSAPSSSSSAGAYQAASSSSSMVEGAGFIDSNLIALSDGAGDLLTGLTQLYEGAEQLDQGLAAKAQPGARKIKNGISRANNGGRDLSEGLDGLAGGSGDLAGGLQRLTDGSEQLSAGFDTKSGELVRGSADLVSGLQQIRRGLTKLTAQDSGLPAVAAGARALSGQVEQLLGDLGSPERPGTILGDIARLESTAGDAGARADALKGSVDDLQGALADAQSGAQSLRDEHLDELNDAQGAVRDACTAESCASALDILRNAVRDAETGVDDLASPLESAESSTADLENGLTKLAGSMHTVGDQSDQLRSAVTDLKAGLSTPGCGSGSCGVAQGIDGLVTSLDDAVAGLGNLVPGVQTAAEDAVDLATGVDSAGEEAEDLAADLGDAARGSERLADGAGESAAHSDRLAARLDQLDGDGSTMLSGLQSAANKSGKLLRGSEQLDEQRIVNLRQRAVGQVEGAAVRQAMLQETAQIGRNNSMPIGAPDSALGSSAFTFELAGADPEGALSLSRGLLALVVFALAAALAGLGRRRTAPARTSGSHRGR
ncbi:MAG: hypothetical protein ACRDO1_04580 [Nocardioidaceae bacterium]